MALSHKLAIILVFILIPTMVFAQGIQCVEAYKEYFKNCENCVTIDTNIITDGSNMTDPYVGGYFWYGLTITNISDKNVASNISIKTFNPVAQYINGFDQNFVELNTQQSTTINPIRKEGNFKVFPFDLEGVYRIEIKSDPPLKFVHCYKTAYIEYTGDFNYYFDAMPKWQKELQEQNYELTQKTIQLMEDTKSLNSEVKELTTQLLYLTFWLFFVTILLVIIQFFNKKGRYDLGEIGLTIFISLGATLCFLSIIFDRLRPYFWQFNAALIIIGAFVIVFGWILLR